GHVGAREAGAAHLLEEQGDVDDAAAAAAILGGNQQAWPAEDGDLLPQLGGESALARGALRRGLRRAVAPEEFSRRRDEELLAVGEAKVHGLARPCLCWKAETARGDRGAENLRGATRDGLAKARLVDVLDGAAELGPARARRQRPVEPQHLH